MYQTSNYSGRTRSRRYPIAPGIRVFVYRNLNVGHLRCEPVSQVMYSLQARARIEADGFDPLPYGTVFHHSPVVRLRDCRFIVREGCEVTGTGWRAVRHTGRKNVHAGIVGTLVSWGPQADISLDVGVTYDPFANSRFSTACGRPVYWAGEVCCSSFPAMGRLKSRVDASDIQFDDHRPK